jgi:3-methyladenine DNA glycosylase AlkD
MDFISELTFKLSELKNIENAKSMQAYMKDNFVFLGIKTKERRVILQNLWKKHQQEIEINFRAIAWELFNKKEREFHYCGVEIMIKEAQNKYSIEDIELIEKFIITHSWWDSVDFIAKYILGNYLRQFPKETFDVIERFSNANNMWLNRSAIIFQLDYKATTNFDLLISECEKHKNSKEFFIQKAIGWALRDYSRFNPNGVQDYVNSTQLKPLSQREALRLILK